MGLIRICKRTYKGIRRLRFPNQNPEQHLPLSETTRLPPNRRGDFAQTNLRYGQYNSISDRHEGLDERLMRLEKFTVDLDRSLRRLGADVKKLFQLVNGRVTVGWISGVSAEQKLDELSERVQAYLKRSRQDRGQRRRYEDDPRDCPIVVKGGHQYSIVSTSGSNEHTPPANNLISPPLPVLCTST